MYLYTLTGIYRHLTHILLFVSLRLNVKEQENNHESMREGRAKHI